MIRHFKVTAHTAPHMKIAVDAMECDTPFAMDAAITFRNAYLPDYNVLPGRVEAPGLWRFEGYDSVTEFGCVIWVREESCHA